MITEKYIASLEARISRLEALAISEVDEEEKESLLDATSEEELQLTIYELNKQRYGHVYPEIREEHLNVIRNSDETFNEE